ncbi:MAG: hypothetical protein ACRBN8_21735 [Nannocystales bacterium]
MSKHLPPNFGPGYVPPAERIRREQASQRQPGPGHDFRQQTTGGKSNSLPLWLVGVVVLSCGALFARGVLQTFEGLEQNIASCVELDEAIGHYLGADPNARGVHIERSRDVLEEFEILARVSGEFAEALESLELPDSRVSDLRDRFAEHALDSEAVLSSFRCTFIANQAEVCDFVPPGSAKGLDQERSRLFKEFNDICPGLSHGWVLESELEPN